MRIALVTPTYWPEVRRGSERLTHDLGVALVERGHEVTILTTHPGRTRTEVEDGVRVRRGRRPPDLPARLGFELLATSAAPQAVRALRGGFDIAHSVAIPDGWAISMLTRAGGPPLVHSFHGVPTPESVRLRRGREALIRGILRRARAVSVLSRAAAEPFARTFGTEPLVLPGGVRMGDFAGPIARSETPTLFCSSSLGDPRKRGPLLVSAFAHLRRAEPDLRLLLAGGSDPHLSHGRVGVPDGAETVDADATAVLARHYASAWATVLPSVDEAFGLVLLESLAAGTPVVAARSGGVPEIVDDPRIGRLFEPDDEASLREAIEGALELAGQPETAELCRARAAVFDWSSVVRRYEGAYLDAR